MPNESNSKLESVYRRLIEKRDRIRARMQAPPKANPHVSIAVFEAWADGLIDEASVRKQIAKFHTNVSDCAVCSDNFEYYRARRAERCREARDSGAVFPKEASADILQK
jgi:hypothetical protein